MSNNQKIVDACWQAGLRVDARTVGSVYRVSPRLASRTVHRRIRAPGKRMNTGV
jgi:hypothetical protein